jgi:two-component system cell cycle sensor histidine kinase PleC
MSHELRTPLNAIIGFSEVIERGFFGPAGHSKYVEYAHDIGDAGRGLHSKIGDILEFASIEAGRYPLEMADADIVPVARACIEEVAGQTFARRVKLAVALPHTAMARVDAIALKRVLTNLLSNASRYTPENGTIRIEAQNEAASVCLRIKDSGTGFQPRERSRISRPFTRFERSGTQAGLGLGLSVAMALARRMGGALVIRSVAGEGTVAELRLIRS